MFIIITGVAMGLQQNWWRFAWIWVALATLILAIGAMNGLSRPYHNVRVAVGVQAPRGRRDEPQPGAPSEQLAQVVARANPWLISVIGIVAILLLIWLMVLKPF
jgi:hypothetical protein